MLKILVDEKKCNGCGKCVEVCPKGPRIWKFEDRGNEKKAVVADASFCLYCGMCVTVCPTAAIKIEQFKAEAVKEGANVMSPSVSPE